MSTEQDQQKFEELFPRPTQFITLLDQLKVRGEWLDIRKGFMTGLAVGRADLLARVEQLEQLTVEINEALKSSEKCEPLGAMEQVNKAISELVPDYYKAKSRELNKLCTAPQPREWIGLSEEQHKEILKEFFKRDRPFEWLISTTEAKLQELNTKG